MTDPESNAPGPPKGPFPWLGCGCWSVGLLLGVSVLAFSLWRLKESSRFIRFDRLGWLAQSPPKDPMWPVRQLMVDDLRARGLLTGLTREGVLDLLGPPADPGFPAVASEVDLHYMVGPERGFMRIDSEWLMIDLDEAGRVERTWLYTD